MTNIKILDCTLRDGGYINDWKFGRNNIISIISRLTNGNIDIVECGFLEDGGYDKDRSLFNHVDQIEAILPKTRTVTQYVAMTRYGYLDVSRLKEYDGKSINGIRVTFHEDEVEEAIAYCRKIQDKGYRVYVQPVGTTSYSDSYLLKLIELVNQINPFAFYIVDTLGLMRKTDLLRMFYLVDNNLRKEAIIGFHSHNNLQLSFSNAQELADLHTKRSIIVDSSVYGMGRGAGNLNTELIAQHLNSTKDNHYISDYLLEIVDETITPIMEKHTWGYSVPYYLAAINNCHPNYASYLMNRKTLQVKSISSILNRIIREKRELYDEKYVQELYMQYQEHGIEDQLALQKLHTLLYDKKIMVLAPGGSVKRNIRDVQEYIKTHNAIVIAVNFAGDEIEPDYCFFSNEKRFLRFLDNQAEEINNHNVILTSNINASHQLKSFVINYSDYLNSQPLVNDNATLMLLALLIKLGIKSIDVAGFDGFRHTSTENYAEVDFERVLDKNNVLQLNSQITEVVNRYAKQINLNFITESLFQQGVLKN